MRSRTLFVVCFFCLVGSVYIFDMPFRQCREEIHSLILAYEHDKYAYYMRSRGIDDYQRAEWSSFERLVGQSFAEQQATLMKLNEHAVRSAQLIASQSNELTKLIAELDVVSAKMSKIKNEGAIQEIQRYIVYERGELTNASRKLLAIQAAVDEKQQLYTDMRNPIASLTSINKRIDTISALMTSK
ncbi:MAG: hypothetical protein ACRC5C_07035 [Bacilli bacterium]